MFIIPGYEWTGPNVVYIATSTLLCWFFPVLNDQIIADKFPGNRNDHNYIYHSIFVIFFVSREIARDNLVILNQQPYIYHTV